MPNVLLTRHCILSCPYCDCVVEKNTPDPDPKDVLSWENLIYLADFLEASGERNLSITGGEPTLHPYFTDFIIYLLERNFDIKVLTCGLMSDHMLGKIISILNGVPENRLNFICNLNDPEKTNSSSSELTSIKHFLNVFGSRVSVSFTIYHYDFRLDFLFHYINQYGLMRTIRLGIAHPSQNKKKNSFISIDDLDQVIERLYSYRPLFERLRIKPYLDCGFPMCRFSDSQLGWFSRYAGEMPNFRCDPIIYIGPDMTVWPCLPLPSFHKKSIFEFNSLQDIFHFYGQMMGLVRMEVGGIFEECDSCVFREDGMCSGGCLSHALCHFQDEARVRVPEVYS